MTGQLVGTTQRRVNHVNHVENELQRPGFDSPPAVPLSSSNSLPVSLHNNAHAVLLVFTSKRLVLHCCALCFDSPRLSPPLRSISSIRGELVPYLVRKQFSKAANSQTTKDEADDQSQKHKDGNVNLGG